VDNLVKAGILDSENNMEYVVPFLPKYIASKNQHIKNLDASIEYLHGKVNDNENHIKHLEDQFGHLQYTIEAFNGVKFSVKHVAKNKKRKILNPKD
jgi:predicted RNase H-like nuclease (RuvC/YqgF family)